MEITGTARRVRIYIDEGDTWQGRPLYIAIIERLRREGAAGATVLRGMAGFGAHSQIHTAGLEVLSANLPLVIEWVDHPERVARLLPEISHMVVEGLITVETVEVVKYAHRALRPIPPDLRVREVMTPEPVTVRPDTSLRELVELLINRDYRAVPVVDEEGRLLGIITNTDLIERGGLRMRVELLGALDPAALAHELDALAASGATAAAVMTRQVVTVSPDERVAAAAHLMVSHRLKRLPVVDAASRVVGMLSRADILRTIGEGYPPWEEAAVPAVARGAGRLTVADVMTRQVPVVRADALLPEVLDAVISTRLNRAVVVDSERRPAGIITDAELLRRVDPQHHAGLVHVLMSKLPFVHLSPEQQALLRQETGTRAADLMITPVEAVREDTPVAEAARRMITERRKLLPVVDAQGRLVGMVDRADLLRAVASPHEEHGPER